MVPEPVLRLVPYLGTFILASRGEELQFCCPFCTKNGQEKSDTKFHFYLHIGEHKPGHDCKSCLGHFYCHRCGASGRTLGLLYARLGLSLEEDPLAPQDPYEAVCGVLNSKQVQARMTPQDIGLPDEYRPVPKDSLAYQYILSRGISPQEIEDYELGMGTGKLDWRIIIPNRSETGFDMWQARDYRPVDPSPIKYKTPTGALDSLVLFNRIRATRYPVVMVCEGPISAMVAGPGAVASWGKHLSAAHVELLIRMRAAEYWIAYDGDAVLAGLAAASTLFARGKKVRFLRLPGKEDPASLGREAVQRIGGNTMVFDQLTPTLVMADA